MNPKNDFYDRMLEYEMLEAAWKALVEKCSAEIIEANNSMQIVRGPTTLYNPYYNVDMAAYYENQRIKANAERALKYAQQKIIELTIPPPSMS